LFDERNLNRVRRREIYRALRWSKSDPSGDQYGWAALRSADRESAGGICGGSVQRFEQKNIGAGYRRSIVAANRPTHESGAVRRLSANCLSRNCEGREREQHACEERPSHGPTYGSLRHMASAFR
jgi:hypothetical protein